MRIDRDDSTGTFDSVQPPHGIEILAPGTELSSRYEIRGVLGSGGNAVVYLARDRELENDVALKVLRRERTSTAAMLRLRREITIARAAASPHLVRIFDIHAANGALYLSMEHIDGETLRDRMRRGPMSVDDALRVTRGILLGLDALHRHGVVHRDVKPGNVLIDREGVVKLVDFGLARRFDTSEERATESGSFVGTVDYVAPEQALGLTVDHRADLYACGAVLFEMLTGHRPFEAEEWLSTILARVRKAPPDVRELRRDCPRWLSDLVRRLLSRDADDRYASAAAALLALDRRKPEHVRIGRRALLLAAAGATVIALVAFGVSLIPRYGGPRFSRIVDRSGEVVAITEDGSALWSRSGVQVESAMQYVRVRMPRGQEGLALFLHQKNDFTLEATRTLSLVDPDSGDVIRRARMPDAAQLPFLQPDRYGVASALATDVDRDGVNEVVASFIHLPQAPSYTVMYDLTTQQARSIFAANGHHRVVGSVDLDRDGTDEIILAGINNALGWVNAVAAVRVPPRLAYAGPLPPAFPPDHDASPETLLWYTFIPKRLMERPSLEFEDGVLTLQFPDGSAARLTADGFDAAAPPRPGRAEARERAFTELRASLKFTTQNSAEAVPLARRAVDAARMSGDAMLIEVATEQLARALVRSGRAEEGDRIFRALTGSSSYSEEIGHAAALAHHLSGDLPGAERWYRATLDAGMRATRHVHTRIYAIEGLVFAAAEREDWQSAMDVLDTAATSFDLHPSDLTAFLNFVRWRSGRIGDIEVSANPQTNVTDLDRYWTIEHDHARGADAGLTLARLERDVPLQSVVRGMALSLRAELLAKLGRIEESADSAREALRLATLDSARSIEVRAHLALIRSRHARFTRMGPAIDPVSPRRR